MNYYIVTLRLQFAAYDETDGIRYRICARSAADAIRYARRRAWDDGHGSSVTGRATYRARLDADQGADDAFFA